MSLQQDNYREYFEAYLRETQNYMPRWLGDKYMDDFTQGAYEAFLAGFRKAATQYGGEL